MAIKYSFETSQGKYVRDRSQSEIKAQRDYEYQLRVEAQRTLERLRAEGRQIVIHYSDSYVAASRGIEVLPTPRLTPDGFIAWTVR